MTKASMPTWRADQLIDAGQMSSERITKKAHPRRCQSCGLFVLVGLDDILPSVIHADLHPTTASGEAFALLTGRATYELDARELFLRSANRIAYLSAEQTAVFTEHSCGSPPMPANPVFTTAKIEDQNDPPPF